MNDLTPEVAEEPISCLLLDLGKYLLHDPRNVEGFDLPSIVRICRERGLKLQDKFPTAEELEGNLMRLFAKADEICTHGISITWDTTRIGWDLVFVLRFYPDTHRHQIQRTSTIFEEVGAVETN